MTLRIINLTLKIFLLVAFFTNKSMAKSTNSVADNYFANAKINSDLFVDLISHKNKNDLDNKREFNQTLVRARFINNLHLNADISVEALSLGAFKNENGKYSWRHRWKPFIVYGFALPKFI